MSTRYEVIPWDHAGYGLRHPELPETPNNLADVARLIQHPADSIIVIEDGVERLLTEEEWAELDVEQQRLRDNQKAQSESKVKS